jgi:chorismate--pyruvate lyase
VDSPIFDIDTRSHKWHSPNAFIQPIPEDYRQWLFLPGSLTKALKQRSGEFSVEVLSEEHLMTSQPILGFTDHGRKNAFFSRKVALKNGSTPWVMAHTLIPETSLQRGLGKLSHLNNRPLGELLFADPSVKKDNNEITYFDNIWGRRSRYWLQGLPLLVSEYFLPELINQL